jgi:pyridoxine/pyridoxamine 5'-phosphate oxidase
MPWLPQLQSLLHSEWASSPWIATLATVDAHNHPDARSIVIRKIDPDGVIWIASDARSAKHQQLSHNDSAAIVIYLPQRRAQFRLQGSCIVAGADEEPSTCLDIWNLLSQEARALFFAPAPGTHLETKTGTQLVSTDEKRDDKKLDEKLVASPFPSSLIARTDLMPDHFAVIAFSPAHVDFLDLTTTPHTRIRFIHEHDGWTEHPLNP